MTDYKALNALVPEKGHQKVDKFAKQRGMTLSNLIRLAVVEYINRHGGKISVQELSTGEWGGWRERDADPDEILALAEQTA